MYHCQNLLLVSQTKDGPRSTDRLEKTADKRLAQMKHDIRAPIGTVMGIATVLGMSDSLTSRQEEVIKTLSATANELNDMIENLFDFVQGKEPATPIENSRAGEMPYQTVLQFPNGGRKIQRKR